MQAQQTTIIFFDNDNTTGASIGARFVDHSDEETQLRFSTHDGSSVKERIFMDGSGNFGINMIPAPVSNDKVLSIFESNTPRIKLHNSTTGTAGTDGAELNMSGSNFIIENRESGQIKFFTAGAGRSLIDSDGTTVMAVGNTNCLELNTSVASGTGRNIIRAFSDSSLSSDGNVRFVVFDSGNVQNTNNSYAGISDSKLKENITDATPKLDKLMQVKVRSFNFIGDTLKQIGVVAQEVETVFPNIVEDTKDQDSNRNFTGTTTKAVKYSVFVPMLIKAMQEQQTIINDLKTRIETLES